MRLILLFLMVCFTGLFAADIKMPPEHFVNGWTKMDNELIFTAGDLYGHINGGAELFLELGFRKLTVQNYADGTLELSLEVYEMDSSLSALGIYLQKCGREAPSNSITARNTVNSYQLLAVKDRYYLQVNNFSGEERAKDAMLILANSYLEQLEQIRNVDPFKLLPISGRVPGSERILRGPYSLQRIYTFGDGDMLKLGGQIFGFAAKYKSGAETYTQIYIAYPDRDKALNILQHMRNNLDSYLEVVSEKDDRFIFKDYKEQFGIIACSNNLLNIKTGLSKITDK